MKWSEALKEPREWILRKGRIETSPNHYECFQEADGIYVVGDGKEVRVIEYSAYEQILKERDKAYEEIRKRDLQEMDIESED